MNAAGSQVGQPQSGNSQAKHVDANDPRSGSKPSIAGREAGDALVSLGRLLRGHTWRDSQDWARALERLSRLSEDDLERVIEASPEPSPT